MTTRHIRRWTVALGLLVVTGCGSSGDRPEPPLRSVTVVLDWTPNTNHTGLYLAKAQGAYAAAGLDVQIIEPGQEGGLGPVAAGAAEFAISYAEQLLPARAAGTPVVSVAAILTTNTSSLVAPGDRGITRPRDLEGKVYGSYGGPIEEPLVKALVRCDGGDPEKVRFVDAGNADYAVGFRRRAYDAIWAFDGWDVIRLRDVGKQSLTTIALRDHFDCIPDWYTPIVAASERLLADDPKLVRAFLAATAAGYRAAVADPQAAADALLDAAPESDRALVERSARFLAPFYAVTPTGWRSQDPAVWRAFTTFLQDNGIVPASLRPADAFTNAALTPP